jgi:hypothetical protein
MKKVLIYSLGLLSCLFENCNNSRTEILLPDSLGTISFKQHSYFDTLYQGRRNSDCVCCGYTYSILANKNLPLRLDKGFIVTPSTAPRYDFTIIQPEFKHCLHDSLQREQSFDDSLALEKSDYYIASSSMKKCKWQDKVYTTVDNHAVIIYSFKGETTSNIDSTKLAQLVMAHFHHKGHILKIEAWCTTGECPDFIEEMKELVYSMTFQ